MEEMTDREGNQEGRETEGEIHSKKEEQKAGPRRRLGREKKDKTDARYCARYYFFLKYVIEFTSL